MQTIWGRIKYIDIKERIFAIENKRKTEYYYFSRSQSKKFRSYLNIGLYVFFVCKEEKVIKDHKVTKEVVSFTKLMRYNAKHLNVFYDIDMIQKAVNKLLSKDAYRMFVDFEFTMPSYNYITGNGFRPEIIQYGIYLEDPLGNLVLTEHSNVLPFKLKDITDRTYDFLNLSEHDFKRAESYNQFYNKFKDIMSMYQPVVYVWGKNDIYVLDLSCEMHKKPKLLERKQIINLMQILKNYYSIKSDIGLFNAYGLFNRVAPIIQDHDSLNDAVATSEIFHLFLEEIKKNSR